MLIFLAILKRHKKLLLRTSEDELRVKSYFPFDNTQNCTGILKLFPLCCLTEQENVTVEELIEKWKLVGHQVKRAMI